MESLDYLATRNGAQDKSSKWTSSNGHALIDPAVHCPDKQAEHKDIKERLLREAHTILFKDYYRSLVRVVEGSTYAEGAKEVGLTIGVFKGYVRRARIGMHRKSELYYELKEGASNGHY